jgi:predicted transcriptional regulator
MRPSLVRDVMTRRVVTATAHTPLREITRLLARHRLDTVPIVDDDNRVVGTASAGEVTGTRPPMVSADAPLTVAALKMHHGKLDRLLVVGADRRLLGVVARADVLRPLTRTDTAIREGVERALRRALSLDPGRVRVAAHNGVVTLTGTVGRSADAAIATRLAGHVPGVTTVVDHLRVGSDGPALPRSRAR